MRPEILFPVFAPLTNLSGVGPRIAKLIERVAGPALVDLFWHLPTGLIDRRYAPKVAEALPGAIATITLQVDKHFPARNRRMPYKIVCSDDSGDLTLVFFHAREDYLRKTLPEGETRIVSGKIEMFNDQAQITHPDHIGTLADIEDLQRVEPVYALTQGLSLKVLSKAMTAAVKTVPELPEWIEPTYLKKQDWPDWQTALLETHAPQSLGDLEPTSKTRMRLAYDELLSNQLALALVRTQMRKVPGRAVKGDGSLRKKVTNALPFALTGSQETAITEILEDAATPNRMHRLLQGDVGSGKTLVALSAMLNAVESGSQAAMLAPTEILARQHMATIEPMVEPLGLQVTLLTGREKGKNRAAILEGLADGKTHIAIGTHALFQDGVEFQDLAIAVVDEQHRFGVHQRLLLTAKGTGVDVLVMTATPIPRTLMLTAYGDMEVARLLEKPAGRQSIDTRALPMSRLDQVIDGIKRAVQGGAQVYWVCPLIEESETLDLAAVEDRHALLQRVFGDQVGLLHGRMKAADKDASMAAFGEGKTRILVATTVIEVGVDVPAATVMVIDHAERFGLAQLHQLRGRIGRGADKSTCLLLYGENITATARSRIKVLRETDDGFKIAEEDLRLRGAGELLGTRQSGVPEFKLADLSVHGELLAAARDDSKLIIERDPELTDERGKALRVLLYLFERDAAVRYLRSG